MELHEYPRPANDTGIGIHWTVGFASDIGIGKIRDFWIPEMKAMGVKWVKIFNHDGAIDFAELLLAEGIMPIVRIYRPSPNPGTLDIREIVHLDAFIRAGVRYFEFNSEPDRDDEWKGGRVPANGLDLVVENTIANMETILERGGMPAIPAVSNGSRWDLVGQIVAQGRQDLLNGPVWQAIHNYSRNRPLDYPYDIGNQEGAAYTQRFYTTLANEEWDEDAWRGRSLQDVNRLRVESCNPGASIMDDHACWLAYEYFDARNRRHLGHSIPILSTECGYLVGEDSDARYPATTPDLHMAQTLEACRAVMGTSSRYPPAPDYYFCTAFWLIGNAVLGSASRWCEHHAWYSRRWPGDTLPIVPALKAEPKDVRRWQEDVPVGSRTMLNGTVSNAGDRSTVILEQNGAEVTRTKLDANSRYLIPDLLPGNYTLHVEGTAVEQPVNILPGQARTTVNLDLAESYALSGSTLRGAVRGGAGAVVLLLRTNDGEEWVTMAKEDGSFRFVDLPPGAYNLRVQGEGSHVAGILLDGKNQREVELAVAGWGYTVQTVATTGDRAGIIQCNVEGKPGLRVWARTEDWRSEPVETGRAPHLGEGGCEIGPLEPGYYVVEVEGLTQLDGAPCKLEAYVNLERRTRPLIHFVFTTLEQITADLHNSTLRGRVIGGSDREQPLTVRLIDDQANRQEQPLLPDCTFRFDGLGPGLYSIEVVGYADVAGRSDIALDGKNTVNIELLAPTEEDFDSEEGTGSGASVIAAAAPESAERMAKLVDSVGNERRQIVAPNDAVHFERLAGGVYTLSIEGGYTQRELIVDGTNGLFVTFQSLVETWEAKVSPAGSMPGYSVVRVEVEGLRGLPVYIWKEDWEGMMRRTGSKPEYGDYAAEFSPLGPGHYMVEPEGLGIWADVELTGLEVVWIDFRRKSVPSSPHVVEPLDYDRHPTPAVLPATSQAPTEFEGHGTDHSAVHSENFDSDEFDSDASPSDLSHSHYYRRDDAPQQHPADEAWFDDAGAEDDSQADYNTYAYGSAEFEFDGRGNDTPQTRHTESPPLDDAGAFDEEFAGGFEPVFDEPDFDEPVFDELDSSAAAPPAEESDTHEQGESREDRQAPPFSSGASDDRPEWLRTWTTSDIDITPPTLTGFDDDDFDPDDYVDPDEIDPDENSPDEDEFRAEDRPGAHRSDNLNDNDLLEQFGHNQPASKSETDLGQSAFEGPPQDTPHDDPAEAAGEPSEGAERTLCLYIPNPITDNQEMTALLRFVSTHSPAVAYTFEDIPKNSHVLLIGTEDTENLDEIEQELIIQKITFEKISQSLTKALAKWGDSDLH